MSGGRRWLAATGPALVGVACAAWPASGYGWPAWAWAAGMALYVGGFPGARRVAAPGLSGRVQLLLAALLVAGAAVRLPWLAEIPPAISIDEVLPGVEALRLARGEAPNVFSSLGWFRMPALSFVVQGAALALWPGAPFWALRLSSAVMGLAGLAVTFALGRRCVGERGALAATFLMTVSFWHVHNSRTGFPFWQASLGPALVLYLLVRGRQDDSRACVALAGVVAGLVLQWYFPVRILLLVVPLCLALDAWERRPAARGVLRDMAVFGGGALLAGAPLLAAVPAAELLGRSRDVLRPPGGGPWTWDLVADNFAEAWGMLGRWAYVAVLQRSPAGLLDLGTRTAAFVGLAVAMLSGRVALLFLAGWTALTFVAGVALTDAPRASYRLAAAMPAIFLLAGVGVEHLLASARAPVAWYARTVRRVVVGAAAVGVAAYNLHLVFVAHPRGEGRESVHGAALRAAAAFCDGRPVLVALGFGNGPALELFCRTARDVEPEGLSAVLAAGEPAVVLLPPDRAGLAEVLVRERPGAQSSSRRGPDGRPLVIVVELPAAGGQVPRGRGPG